MFTVHAVDDGVVQPSSHIAQAVDWPGEMDQKNYRKMAVSGQKVHHHHRQESPTISKYIYIGCENVIRNRGLQNNVGQPMKFRYPFGAFIKLKKSDAKVRRLHLT